MDLICCAVYSEIDKDHLYQYLWWLSFLKSTSQKISNTSMSSWRIWGKKQNVMVWWLVHGQWFFFFLEGGDALYSATMNLITLIPSYCFTAQIIREKMKVCCENIEGGEKMWTRNSKENRFLKKSKNFEMVFRGKKKVYLLNLRPKYI